MIKGSTIANNHAAYEGGGLYLISPTEISNSTITRNVATNGGGGAAYLDGGSLSLNNVTVAGNWSYSGVGGIDANTYTVEFSNSIIARNRFYSDYGWISDCSAGTTSLGHNLLGTDTCDTSGAGDVFGNTIQPLDPRLGSLASNGGPTQTRELLSGSKAIGAGGNDCEAKDQRGVTRDADCDIGAYEK